MVELVLVFQVLTFVFVSAAIVHIRSIFHPVYVYSFFHLIVFVIRPIFVYLYDLSGEWNFFGVRPVDSDICISLLLSTVAYVVFCFVSIAVSPQALRWN